MSWTTLGNGVCPPPPPARFRFVNISAGLDTHMAIDNEGRLYTWGSSSYQYGGQTPVAIEATPNYLRHPATYRDTDNYQAMVYPYQVGTKNNWVKCEHLEYIYCAMDSDGYLYAWGEDGTYGRGGWALGSQYNGTGLSASPFVPGGEQAITPQLINDVQWSDFAAGQYHMLGLKADKTLWIWGKNLDGLTYGSASYIEDYVSRVPIQVTWVPEPIKLISAHYSVNAVVTQSDKIYAWGSWGNNHYPEAIPTLRPLSLPIGASILDIKCSSSGIVVLLSNGQVYAQGWRIGFVLPPGESDNFVLCPISKYFIQIDVSPTGAAAVDNEGNIWAWGNEAYLITNSTGQDIRDPAQPMITAAQNEGDGNWTKVGINSWSHMALDNEGRMWTWGNNVFGLLGIGEFQSAPTVDSYTPVECTPFAVLDDGTPAIESSGASTGAAVLLDSPYLESPAQLTEHYPCGHWHVSPRHFPSGGGGADFSYPSGCWEVTAAIHGLHVAYVACSIYGTEGILLLEYRIDKNEWRKIYEQSGLLCCVWEAGAAIHGNFFGFHGFALDRHGDKFNETYDNPRVLTMVRNPDIVHIQEWFGGPEMHGKSKIALHQSGIVLVLVHDPAGWSVNVSTNHGFSYEERLSLISYGQPFEIACAIKENGHLLVAHLAGDPRTLNTYLSTNSGSSFTLMGSSPVPAGSNYIEFSTDNTNLFACVQSGTGVIFYYSDDDGTTWSSSTPQTPSPHFAADGKMLYNLGDQDDYITMDYTPTSISWEAQRGDPVSKTVTERCTLRNSGQYAVYVQSDLRNDIGGLQAITMLVSSTLGRKWNERQTPFAWYADILDLINGQDQIIWPFQKQHTLI